MVRTYRVSGDPGTSDITRRTRCLTATESLDGFSRPQHLRLPMGPLGPDQRAYGCKTYWSCRLDCGQSAYDDESTTMVDEDSQDDRESLHSGDDDDDAEKTEVEEEIEPKSLPRLDTLERPPVAGSSRKVFICLIDDCRMVFCDRQQRKRHMDAHFHGGQKYQCPMCDGRFTRRTSLERHCRKAGAGACLAFAETVAGADDKDLDWEYFRLPTTMHWFWEPQYITHVRKPAPKDPLIAKYIKYRQLYGLPLD
ncbi:hypothetical protein CERSUDRAFT_73129 [Gelatoporia subvermispora B]|uniref:C2H2-type domain-containing protein n=1 Tax=Ceriporiopsis subvermispora (strain B) TaxID=914234 RepID=M2PQ62_CERS8|nr:hypothetical protein CERSUDRAFT_73129 [Gelatoporia subvermispora B]